LGKSDQALDKLIVIKNVFGISVDQSKRFVKVVVHWIMKMRDCLEFDVVKSN